VGIKNLKILFLSSFSEIGGAEKSLLSLAEGLTKKGVDVSVITNKKGPLTNSLKRKKIRCIVFSISHFQIFRCWQVALLPFKIFKLAKLVKGLAPDIIHCNNQYSAQWGVLIARILKIPVVVHHRAEYFSPISKLVYNSFGKNIANIYISKFIEKQKKPLLNKQCYRGNKVICNPVALKEAGQKACSDLRRKLKISERDFVILFLGRIDPLKGLHRLINAVSGLKHSVKVIVAGSSSINRFGSYYEKKCRKMIARNDLQDKFIFSGFVDGVENYMKAADILTVPSKNEGFGRVIIEAMISGIPIIADKSGGITEIIRNNTDGLLINSSDIKLFIKTLESAIGDSKLRARLITNGKKRAKSFSVDDHVKRVMVFYKGVLK